MAIARVQELLLGGTCSAGSTLTATGTKTVTAGNDIFVFWVADKNATVTSVTDNLGNSYAVVYDSTVYAEADTPSVGFGVVRATNIAGGTLSSIATDLDGFCRCLASFEYSGIGVTAIASGLGSSEWAFNSTSPQGAAIPGDGINWFVVGSRGNEGTWTPPTGYTDIGGNDTGTASTDRGIRIAEKIGTITSGTLIASFTNAVDWVTGGAFATEPLDPPALTAAYSFDGVTVR